MKKQKKSIKQETLNEAKKLLSEYLSKKKLRKTQERFAVLELIYSIKGHFDTETLLKLIKDQYPLSRATLYNTINLLLECNLIIKHQFDKSGSATYEKALKTNHNHLICSQCGTIREFGDESLRKIIQYKPLRGFQTSHYTLYIYGICSKCAKSMEKK